MIGIYIRIKIDGKRTFRATPEVPGEFDYWLKSTYNGRQKWHRVGRYDAVKKAKLLLEREQERKEAARKYGLVAPPAIGHVTVSEGVEKFIQRKVAAGKRPGTVTAYKFTLGLFQEFCPHLYVEEITGDTLLDFAAWCRKRGDAERTVANRFVDLASFMKFHGKTGLVPKSDWPKYTERRLESYTQDELDKFYAAAKTDKERLLLDLLIHSGFRIGEIAHLCYSDVDFTGNKLHVQPKPQWNWVPKTHECRTVRVPGKVILAMSQWRDQNSEHQLIFPSKVGRPDEHMLRIVDDLGDRACIMGRYDAHKFRATFATRNSGRFRPQDVQRMLGHRNIETTMPYLAVSDLGKLFHTPLILPQSVGWKNCCEGHDIPPTRIHKSGKGFAHVIFLNTPYSNALGNCSALLPDFCHDNACEKADRVHKHEWFSFRSEWMYVVGPGSTHPNGRGLYNLKRIALLSATADGDQFVTPFCVQCAWFFMLWQAQLKRSFKVGTSQKVSGGELADVVMQKLRAIDAKGSFERSPVIDGVLNINLARVIHKGDWASKYGSEAIVCTVAALVKLGQLGKGQKYNTKRKVVNSDE